MSENTKEVTCVLITCVTLLMFGLIFNNCMNVDDCYKHGGLWTNNGCVKQ